MNRLTFWDPVGQQRPCLAEPSRLSRVESFTKFFIRAFDALDDWRERGASRRRLLTLDDRMLQDIGLNRAAAFIEACKPFWRG